MILASTAEVLPEEGAEDPCKHGLHVGEGGMRSAIGHEVAEIVHDLGQHRLVVDKRAVVGAEGVV